MAEPILELQNVSKRYDSPSGQALVVLEGLTLKLAPGESLAIVGPSGCGKSTLLNIMGALDTPSEGKVLLEGRDIGALGDNALAEVRNKRVGFIFQMHHLLPQLTVLENVLVPTLAFRTDAQAARRQADRLLDRVGLAGRAMHRPGELSGGERQRAAVVRALINKPPLLLADEPTGALDEASARNLADLLVQINAEEGVTLVVVTHSSELAGKMGRSARLHEGRLGNNKTHLATDEHR